MNVASPTEQRSEIRDEWNGRKAEPAEALLDRIEDGRMNDAITVFPNVRRALDAPCRPPLPQCSLRVVQIGESSPVPQTPRLRRPQAWQSSRLTNKLLDAQ